MKIFLSNFCSNLRKMKYIVLLRGPGICFLIINNYNNYVKTVVSFSLGTREQNF